MGQREEGEGSDRMRRKKIWKSVWALPYQGKVKHFVWKCLHDIVPVKDVLARRNMVSDVLYPLCKEEEESGSVPEP
ncbi:hypothetical protein RHMOL_Rhmol07G0135700 [Rhododendron molle]|uniref:Uncharacterized protein n=1 Tax=Rhododendron molle TaxID=49168 RepID=A0ACC0N1L6_RHOML|nr:hypothetical protein RHMOL_Rhmol07G0135700 [Rhododendron molle]